MRRAALGLALALAGCGGSPSFHCQNDDSCFYPEGGSGICEPSGFCSYTDVSCPDGRRYGPHAGDGLANQCVAEVDPPDARLDAPPPDAYVCSFFAVTNLGDPCAFPEVGPALELGPGGDPYDYDTDDHELRDDSGELILAGPDIVVPQADGPSLRVLNLWGFDLVVGVELNVSGDLPLVIVVHGSADIRGVIDVEGGAADAALCMAAAAGTAGVAGSGAGGGGGGGFGSGGAVGGSGGAGSVGGAPGLVAGSSSLSPLRGGCAGGDGGGSPGAGGPLGGDGGGAIQIVVRDTLRLRGSIEARGGGGSRGEPALSGTGGGGGGSGGAILLEAGVLSLDGVARLCANGGSGGEGADINSPGDFGDDGTCSATAGAVTGDLVPLGGNGGAGAYLGGQAGTGIAAGDPAAAGGGGGGGLGRIRLHGVQAPPTPGSAILSPAPAIE